ncbi:asparaginase [Embleya sp. NBC_00896]|uniref:asparaginase n=1 Tax=Embleya sp. NBC_00896 TaxID=2975961 RepID=UPI00386CC215|nr:asparaginase [Embleya sp. NBC_00896]
MNQAAHPGDEAAFAHIPVVGVWRNGFLESVHHGTAVLTGADGSVVEGHGAVDAAMFPRSANKPFQGLAMLRNGLDLDGELLALACASHSGEAFHLDGTRRILARAGLSESALRCVPDLPLGAAQRDAWLAAGNGPERIAMNCSGKHAAMLLTCVHNGWSIEDYLAPDHPLQKAVRRAVEDVAGEPVAAAGVDGCGAPLFAISLAGLARSYGRFAGAAAGTPERRIADAMRAHPEWVAGTGRDVTNLMRAVPGLLAKDGAEAVFAVGLADGRGAAIKIADGGVRAGVVAMAALLWRMGADEQALAPFAQAPVYGAGEVVGAIRAFPLLGEPAV